MPGSFDIYVKKYLQRGHTGMTNWFNDDIQDPTTSDYYDDLANQNAGVNLWNVYRSGEFNGLRIGADFVPVRNTKLLLYYTYGKLGLFNPPTGRLRAYGRIAVSSVRSGKYTSEPHERDERMA